MRISDWSSDVCSSDLIFLILLSLIAGFWSDGVVAQQPQDLQRIVALVNDEVISVRDLMERTRVIMVTGNLPDTPEVRRAVRDQAMRSMIDERLEMQEAKKRGISVPQADVDSAVARLEEQNHIPAGRFEDFAARAGIDARSEEQEHTSELQSLMRNSYAVFCFKKNNPQNKDDPLT